jgi:hypothetical protein
MSDASQVALRKFWIFIFLNLFDDKLSSDDFIKSIFEAVKDESLTIEYFD